MRLVASMVGLALFTAIPGPVAGQDPAPTPPPALDPRPMRFLLSTGAVVIGTRIGETRDAMGVQTRGGIVTIRKDDLVTMDYRVERGRQFDLRGTVSVARPAPPVPPPARPMPPRRRRPGLALQISGGIVFGLSYGLACVGAIASTSNRGSQDGLLLAIPVVGPGVWAALDRDRIEAGLLWTAVEVVGAALLAFGVMAADEAERDASHRNMLVLAPLLTAEAQGLVVAGTL